MGRQIRLELLPHERTALLTFDYTPEEVRSRLKACGSSDETKTITIDSVHLRWLAGDMTHAIVKRGCRDADVVELSERLDYVNESGDGSLDAWYG